MSITLHLALLTVGSIVLISLLYPLSQSAPIAALPHKIRQLYLGISLGLLACINIGLSVEIGDRVISPCNGIVLTAGLVFGGPAGILAGLIAGFYNYLCTFWLSGVTPHWSTAFAAILAGFIGAGLRTFLFEDKRPNWSEGILFGCLVPVFNILFLILSNINNLGITFAGIKACAFPFIAVNGLVTGLTLLAINIATEPSLFSTHHKKTIIYSFEQWILAGLAVAVTLSTILTWAMQTQVSTDDTDLLLTTTLADVKADLDTRSDQAFLTIAQLVAWELDEAPITVEIMDMLVEFYGLTEMSVIGEDGIICYSTQPSFLGFNMNTGEQSSAFLALLDGTTVSLVQALQPMSENEEILRKYAAYDLETNGFVQIGLTAEQLQESIDSQIDSAATYRHIGENGAVLIADLNGTIVSATQDNLSQSFSDIGLDLTGLAEGDLFTYTLFGTAHYCCYIVAEGYTILGIIPVDEATFSRDITFYLTLFTQLTILGLVFVLIFLLVKGNIIANVRSINQALGEITHGNLAVSVDCHSNQEFSTLSDGINATVDTLKEYIDEAATRIDEELEFARTIQLANLPSGSNPFPNRKEFELFALMDTAKKVGGDFYDFFFVDAHHLAILIADVSGKGIPAAMFMMSAKACIRSLADAGYPADKVFELANEKLCENNEATMFVTVWMGILDLQTGELSFVNGGHNPPLLKTKGTYAYLATPPNLMLAAMEGVPYTSHQIQLHSGDQILLYTDGVTEAMDVDGQLYGEDRLLSLVNQEPLKPDILCQTILSSVNQYAGEAPQFDDITLLSLTYQGQEPAKPN
ncbi:SpoIIE family protein phosphatase [Bengtsoniella intestinalis]|uniref:SpoIIE family protein phosphatase n=1 Tax=Bengtsoniella intestinalis TaxID=3073143 RepID=UPI00391F38DC